MFGEADEGFGAWAGATVGELLGGAKGLDVPFACWWCRFAQSARCVRVFGKASRKCFDTLVD